MIHSGEERTNGIRCRFNPSIGINFKGATKNILYKTLKSFCDSKSHKRSQLVKPVYKRLKA